MPLIERIYEKKGRWSLKGHKMMVVRCSGVCVQEVLQCRKLQWE